MKINCNFKGQNNNNSKLTDKQIQEIRTQWATGSWTFRSLGARYGVSHAHIYKIIKGKTRKEA